jgi:hypothetical protein
VAGNATRQGTFEVKKDIDATRARPQQRLVIPHFPSHARKTCTIANGAYGRSKRVLVPYVVYNNALPAPRTLHRVRPSIIQMFEPNFGGMFADPVTAAVNALNDFLIVDVYDGQRSAGGEFRLHDAPRS